MTEYRGGFYHLSQAMTLHYDGLEFEQLVDQARQQEADLAAGLRRQAIQRYRTPFFSHLDMPWLAEHREQLRQL